MLAVSDHAPATRRGPVSCSHRRTTWTSTHYAGGAGRSRRSPGMSERTGERSAPTWTGNGRSGSGHRPVRTRSPRTRRTARPGWPRIRICGRPRCSTRSPTWGMTGPTRRSPGRCGSAVSGRSASRAIRRRAARSRSSITRPGRKLSGIGWSFRTRRLAGMGTAGKHTCW